MNRNMMKKKVNGIVYIFVSASKSWISTPFNSSVLVFPFESFAPFLE